MSHPASRPLRRHVIAGLAGLCALPCCRPALAKQAILVTLVSRGGCALQAGELDQIEAAAGSALDFGGKAAIPSSGDAGLDRALGAALVRMAETFGERPGFAFYDDSASPNAFATTDTRVGGTWGTVLFGRTLFWKLVRANNDQGIAVIATIAHEFGHVVQFRRKLNATLLNGQSTVKRTELHADYLSGYYLGTRKRENPQMSLLASGALFRDLGDTDTRSHDHHGTPDERIRSAEQGFKLGIAGAKLDDAIRQGISYVMTV
jgi:hypothetical protein